MKRTPAISLFLPPIALLLLVLLLSACDSTTPRPPDATPVLTSVVVVGTATSIAERTHISKATPVATIAGLQSVVPTADSSLPPGSARVVQRVETNKPYVAITVDDFYTADYRREAAIHILQRANASHTTLTLCPAGSALTVYARKHADQARQIQALVAQGSYELCNHTYTHPVMRKLSVQAQEHEMVRGRAAQHIFFGHDPDPIFRPPFGSWNAQTVQAAHLTGYYTVVTWSVESGDSEGPEKPPQKLLADVACARAGDIILMHANRNSSADALPLIIAMLHKKGLQPVTLSTLLASGKPVYSSNPDDMKHLYTCK